MLYVKNFIGKLLSFDFIGRFIGFLLNDKISIYGFKIDTKSIWIKPQTKSALFFKMYESAELRFVKKYISGDFDIIELGSSIGVVTCHLASKLSNNRLFAIEANPNLIPLINKNLYGNNLYKNTEILNLAITDNNKSIKLNLGIDNITASIKVNENNSNSIIEVEGKKLSTLILDKKINKFDLICDIEGAETDIIFNDSISLNNCNFLVIELHDTPKYSVSQISNQIINLNFKMVDEYHNVKVFKNAKKNK